MTEDTIQLLEAAARPRTEVAVLIQSARESFRLIEPWSYARSDHPETTNLLARVKGQVNAYYIALDRSIGIAEEGHAFALDCIDLCDYLLEPDISIQDLTNYMSLMREKAQTAYVAAKEVSEDFRSVRQGLTEITRDIPAAVLRVEKHEEELRKAQRYEEKRALGAEILSGTLVAVGGVLGAALAISGIIALHSTVVLIPVALPLMALVVKIVSHDYTIVARERATQTQTCGFAMDQLRKSAVDLTELNRHMDAFADWWQDMDTMLETLVSRTSQLRSDRFAKSHLRIKSIQKGWGGVRDQYLDYKTNISKLQDYYPSSRLNSIEE